MKLGAHLGPAAHGDGSPPPARSARPTPLKGEVGGGGAWGLGGLSGEQIVQCSQSLNEGWVGTLEPLHVVDDLFGLEVEPVLVTDEVTKALELGQIDMQIWRQQRWPAA